MSLRRANSAVPSEVPFLQVQRSAIAHICFSSIGTIVLVWYGLSRPLELSETLGLILAIWAFILWATARVQLGSSFSVQPEARALVTRGIYSRIRNPIYVFGAMWIAGLVLVIGKPFWLLILLLLLPMQVVRARRESRVLEEKFGAEYREYRRMTWF
jgi:protein-S-isoprenylcysteine O-methyltransferase Ste14